MVRCHGLYRERSEHPSLSEHFVRYIALYINTAEISRVYLHPVYSFPKVTFTIALDEGGSLRALEEPTHSAAWEASKKINRDSLADRASYHFFSMRTVMV